MLTHFINIYKDVLKGFDDNNNKIQRFLIFHTIAV